MHPETTTSIGSVMTEDALEEKLLYMHRSDIGTLMLSGADRIDFLQRQTTNELSNLTTGARVDTILTSPTARILDVLTILVEQDHLIVVPQPGYAPHTLQFLRSRIFFMDKVTIDDHSTQYKHFLIAADSRSTLSAFEVDLDGLSGGQWVRGNEVASDTMFYAERGIEPTQLHAIVPANRRAEFEQVLENAKGTHISAEDYEVQRIEAGLPAAGHELTENYTPFEVSLDSLVSDSKGCYTGQEVLARQVTHDKVTKSMVGLRMQETVQVGALVRYEGVRVGEVTSATKSPRFGAIALAVLKRPANLIGIEVEVQDESGNSVKGEVVALPFES